jgi:hypothetical protein
LVRSFCFKSSETRNDILQLEAAFREGKKATLPGEVHSSGTEEKIALGAFCHEPNCGAPMVDQVAALLTVVQYPS